MENFKDLLNEINNNLAFFNEKSPHLTATFMRLMELSESPGALDEKTKELISLALAVNAKCKYCIALHVNNCIKLGIKDEEMIEAAWVAVFMGGGPSLMCA